MSISTDQQTAVMDRIEDYAKATEDGFEAWWKQANYGMTARPNDQQFTLWFETMASTVTDWERVMRGVRPDGKPMVGGAKEIVARYDKLRMKAMAGVMHGV